MTFALVQRGQPLFVLLIVGGEGPQGWPVRAWPLAETHGDAARLCGHFRGLGDFRPLQVAAAPSRGWDELTEAARAGGCTTCAIVDGWLASGDPRWRPGFRLDSSWINGELRCHRIGAWGPSDEHEPHGFTLIELLVAVAVIALLIALVLPSFAGATLSARSTVCRSNLKQLHATTFGVWINTGDVPASPDHVEVLAMLSCPLDRERPRRPYAFVLPPGENYQVGRLEPDESRRVWECVACGQWVEWSGRIRP